MTASPIIDPRHYDGVIFEFDHVVTDMSGVEAAAWRQLLNDYAARGAADEGQDHKTLRNLVSPDEQLFRAMATSEVPVGNYTVTFVRKLREAGLRIGTYSSSANCKQVLGAAGIGELFQVAVDLGANDASRPPGGTGAAVLLEAARQLDVEPARCVLIDASQSGVLAGRAAGFAEVIGVGRKRHAEALRQSGADAVVADLAHISVRCGSHRMSTLPDALQSYGQIAAVVAARGPAVLLDFDGTISAIVDHPDAATLVDGAATALKTLAAECDVAVISGRDLGDVVARVGVPGIWYAGSHGFELTAPDGTHHHNETAASAVEGLECAAAELRDQFALLGGVRVEHKRFAVAIHYRNAAPDAVRRVTAVVHTIGQQKNLRVSHGRKVIELWPDVAWDKGKVLEWILQRITRPEPTMPIYIGDDLTDEDAFDAT